MSTYVIRRLLQTILVILGVTGISFGAMFLTGDPTMLMIGDTDLLTQEQFEEFRHRMGFDRPVIVQYLDWLGHAVRGDFGVSLHHGQDNFRLVMERMPATLQLAFVSLLISVLVSFPIGIVAAIRRGTWVDTLTMLAALLGQSLPVFWLGIMFMLIFGVKLRWLPVSGRGTFKHILMPAVSVAVFSIARNARMVRSSMLEVLGMDYVRTARAKGLAETPVILRHVLRNALIPVVTLIGLSLGHLLGGSVITETIFAWPGVGRLTLQAIGYKDFPLVQASVTILALTFVLVNLIVDLLYTVIDPRVRLQ